MQCDDLAPPAKAWVTSLARYGRNLRDSSPVVESSQTREVRRTDSLDKS